VWGLAKAEVVRAYFRKHALASESYRKLAKEGKLPTGFPGIPTAMYKKPWSWFSGNKYTKEWVEPEIVREYFRKHGLTTESYQKLSKAGRLPTGFPGNPLNIYKKPWSWFTRGERKWVRPEVLRDYVRKRRLTWQSYCGLRKANRLPKGFPGDVKVYKKPWSWFSGNDRNWVEAEVVRKYVQKHRLTRPSYRERWKAGELPKGFPGATKTYGKPWSWFSGNERTKGWVKPEVVRDYFRKKGLTAASYRTLSQTKKLPKHFPSDPAKVYRRDWSWFTGRQIQPAG
jgi:hypothetical protein